MGRYHRAITQYEILAWAAAVLYLVYRLPTFFAGETSMCCDAISSEFPVFYYLAEHLLRGVFPLWNPYSHLGEPFYPLLLHTRLLDPTTYLSLFVGHFFTNNLLILFHLHRLTQTLLMTFGIWLVVRRYTKDWRIGALLIPVLLWTSVMFVSFRQPGVLFHFLWIPYIHLMAERLFWSKEAPSFAHWCLFGVLVGIQFQSYWFVATWIYLAVFFLASWRCRLLQRDRFRPGILCSLIVIAAMAAPNFSFYLDWKDFTFPMRMKQDFAALAGLTSSPFADDLSVAIGTRANFWNYLSLIFIGKWGEPAETFMYIGLLPWFFALVGIVFGRSRHKRFWLIVLGTFMLFHWGSPTLLTYFPWLHQHLPLFKLIRHPAQLSLFVLFPLFFFSILGLRFTLLMRFNSTSFWAIPWTPMGIGLVMGSYLGYGLAQLGFHSPLIETHFPLWLLCSGFVFFLLHRQMGKTGLFLALVSSHISAIGFSLQEPMPFLVYCGLGLAPFLTLIGFAKQFPVLRARYLFLLAIGIPLTVELALFIPKFRGFYQSPVTAHALSVPMTPQPSAIALNRVLNPYPSFVVGNPIVNPALLLKVPALFCNNVPLRLTDARKEWPHNNYYLSKKLSQFLYSSLPEDVIAEELELTKPILESLSTPIRVRSFNDNTLELAVSGPTDVVFRNQFHPDWVATLDGKDHPLSHWNRFYMKASIPPGDHTLSFSFFPTPFLFALVLFYLGSILGIAAGILLALRHFKFASFSQSLTAPLPAR